MTQSQKAMIGEEEKRKQQTKQKVISTTNSHNAKETLMKFYLVA